MTESELELARLTRMLGAECQSGAILAPDPCPPASLKTAGDPQPSTSRKILKLSENSGRQPSGRRRSGLDIQISDTPHPIPTLPEMRLQQINAGGGGASDLTPSTG